MSADEESGEEFEEMTSKGKLVIRQLPATSLLGGLDEASVQCVVADPPYGVTYLSNRYIGRNPHGPMAGDWNFQVGVFLSQVARVLRDGGALYLFTRWDVYPLWASSIVPPLKLSNCIVWLKDNWSAGDLSGNYGNQYENLLFITKGRHTVRGYRFSNVWSFPRIPAKQLLVPAQKPVPLIRRAVEASSDAGDLVVDPFCGSGSTGVAALESGRNVILGDIDPRSIRISCSRLGVDEPADCHDAEADMPPCPILSVTPPSPLMWGIHPEDIVPIMRGAYWDMDGEHRQ